jgi:TM2 domain-containing membrane protein YozV
MLSRPKNQKVAIALALSSFVLPVTGLHKFYLGQPVWGVLYLLLSWTPIPRIASVIEGVWYISQRQDEFDQNFNSQGRTIPGHNQNVTVNPAQVEAVASALRELDTLRQDGLISEYEFEQKRRQLLDQIA